ncbi:MAG: glycosyltransferase [Acidimicrobiales bacterium]
MPTIVPNGVPIPATLRTAPRTGSPLVGFIGRLDPNKRVEDFIVAASLVGLTRPEVRFVIAGGDTSGSEYEVRCRELASAMGLEGRLTFAGAVADASDIMRSLDVFVLPSVLEGHPLVVLEAMALGKAVVVTDIPACRDTVTDGVDGRVVPARRPRVLASAVADLLDDPAQRERLGAAARLRAMRDFTEERMVRDLLPFVVAEERAIYGSGGRTASGGEQKRPVSG